MRTATFNFHPQVLHRLYHADFGHDYVWDPAIRARVDHQTAMALHRDHHAHFPTLFPRPEPPENITTIAFSMQPLDFLNGARGADIGYSPDEQPSSLTRSFKHLDTLAAITAENDINWPDNPWWQNVLRYLDQAARLHSTPVRVTGTPCAGLLDPAHSDDAILVTHTAYTTAFRLLGEDIFIMMLADPEAAWALFRYILRQYHNLFDLAAKTFNWTPTRYHFGDCAATMLSPDLFRQYNRLIMEEIAATGLELTWHSCGPSTHLLEAAAGIPRLTRLQLGCGTDPVLARRLFPDAEILAYYGAAALLRETPDAIVRHFNHLRDALQDNFTIMFSSVDYHTPPANVQTAMTLANALNQTA